MSPPLIAAAQARCIWGYVMVLPGLLLAGLMLGSLGLVLSSFIRQLENFAGVMNFIIFPMFFLSSALYPLWKMAESSPLLHDICALNPLTHAVELIRFLLYQQLNPHAFVWVLVSTLVLAGAGVWGYDPARSMARRYGQALDLSHIALQCAVGRRLHRNRRETGGFALIPVG